jgi:hypothetical protein
MRQTNSPNQSLWIVMGGLRVRGEFDLEMTAGIILSRNF